MREWYLVGSFASGFELWRAKTLLEGAGIPTYVQNEHSQSIWGAGLLSSFPLNPAFGPLRLWVPLWAKTQAQTLLASEGLSP
jgi:hypothetical protein